MYPYLHSQLESGLAVVGKAIHSGHKAKNSCGPVEAPISVPPTVTKAPWISQTVNHPTSAFGGGSSGTISSHSFQVLGRKVELRERRHLSLSFWWLTTMSHPRSTMPLSGLVIGPTPWTSNTVVTFNHPAHGLLRSWKFLVLELPHPNKQTTLYMKCFLFEISGDCFSCWVSMNKYTRQVSSCISVALSMKCC